MNGLSAEISQSQKKQTFISIITVISILGVTVGVTAMIIVLSVFSGFEKTLKEKIWAPRLTSLSSRPVNRAWIVMKRC